METSYTELRVSRVAALGMELIESSPAQSAIRYER
jgi:hypothetical protein